MIKIVRAIKLSTHDDMIMRIIFRQPMLDNGIIKYGLAQLSDDEDVDMMFDYISTIRPVDSIVLYVDILSRHHRTEDGGVGPSTSCPIVMEGEGEDNLRNDNCPVVGIETCHELQHSAEDVGQGENDDDTDFLDDLDTDGDDPWIDEEDDIPGVQFNDGDDHDIYFAMCFNSGYENPIRPLIFPTPYSEIDSDVMRFIFMQKINRIYSEISRKNFL